MTTAPTGNSAGATDRPSPTPRADKPAAGQLVPAAPSALEQVPFWHTRIVPAGEPINPGYWVLGYRRADDVEPLLRFHVGPETALYQEIALALVVVLEGQAANQNGARA